MTKLRIGSRVSIENIDIDKVTIFYLYGEVLQISKSGGKKSFLIEFINKYKDTEKRWFTEPGIKVIT